MPPAAEDGTQLLAQASSVRVHWEDSRGQHDRCFARNFRIGRDVAATDPTGRAIG